MNILGISGLPNSVEFKQRLFPNLSPRQYRVVQGLDSAAALVTNNGVVAAAAEERFTGDKGTNLFPVNAMNYCLTAGGMSIHDIDWIAHNFDYEPYQEHFQQDEQLRRQYIEVYSKESLLTSLYQHFPQVEWERKFVRVPHHLAHAASAFYPSGFDEALIFIADGMGEFHGTTVAVGRGDNIEIISQVPGVNSLGLLYGLVTYYLGFHMNSDEYKVMGLAPYGNRRRYFSQFMQLVQLKDDGTYSIPILFKNKSMDDKETYDGTLRTLTELFGPPRASESALTQHHKDLAAGLQAALEACLLHMLRHFKRSTGMDQLCMAGGVALNCTANGFIKRSGLFRDLFVQPASGDDGTALGAALYVQRQHVAPSTERSRQASPRMAPPLWGPSYTDADIQKALHDRSDCAVTSFGDTESLLDHVVAELLQGKIAAWYHGRMEFGPRALGNRSILADPRFPDMRDRLNRAVKKREAFRPFAPAVTAEAATKFFAIEPGDEPMYNAMLFTTQVREEYREQLPAITHVDGSARVQTVFPEEMPLFWKLIDAFGKRTGLPILLNTSFNVRGQPIVCTPTQAIDTFLGTDLDLLVVGRHVVVRPER